MNAPEVFAAFNFDHGIDAPSKFRFGPYEFTVTAEHIASALRMPQHAVVHQTWDHSGHPIVQEADAKAGEIVETASVRLVGELETGHPFLGGPHDPDGIGELCTLLSFLTGREVLTQKDITGQEGTYYGERVVGRNYFLTVGERWPDLQAVQAAGLGPAVWALVNGNSVNDLIGRMCYASAALDLVVTNWQKAQPDSTTPELKKKFKEVRAALESTIGSELGTSDTAKDAIARLGGLFSPSAMLKMMNFLKEKEYMSVSPGAEEVARVKLLNGTRNRVVHTANIPTDAHLSSQRNAEIAMYVLAVTGEICIVHLCDLMKVEDGHIERSRKEIGKFFTKGTFNGQHVEEEDYATYLARLKQNWVATMNDDS
ncbi:hypothetical protein [Pseudoxanthomonas sp. LARHCG66]